MAGGFPLGPNVCNLNDQGTDTANSRGTAITPDASANTKGSYAQLVASSPSDCVAIDISGRVNVVAKFSIDIAVGAAASEIVVIPDLQVEGTNVTSAGLRVAFPIHIPAGSRIAARCQANGASVAALACAAILMDGGYTQMEGAAGVDTIGFDSANTRGTSLTPGAAGTKGSYSQLVASTPRDYIGFVAAVNGQGATDESMFIDIAVGAGGSEQIIVPNLYFRCNSGAVANPSSTPFIPLPIPAGTRIAARILTTGSATNYGLTLYGVYL